MQESLFLFSCESMANGAGHSARLEYSTINKVGSEKTFSKEILFHVE